MLCNGQPVAGWLGATREQEGPLEQPSGVADDEGGGGSSSQFHPKPLATYGRQEMRVLPLN